MLFWFTCMLGYDLGNFVLWAYSQMSLPWTVSVDTPFWACIPFHCSTAHYKTLAWKNHDYSSLGKYWSFGIVLGMGAQLSVVAHNKCGCARTCYWFSGLLICIPRWNFKIVVSLHVLYIKKKKKKKREKTKTKRKEIKRILDLSIVWELKLEVLVFGITFMLDWDLFPIAPLFPWLLSYLSICSTPCPQPHYNLEKSFWSWLACVSGLVVRSRGLPSLFDVCFSGVLWE